MRLDIVVASHCNACEEARVVAVRIRERFPDLSVNVLELDDRHQAPDGVVATPTYLLDGRVVSLGNPRLPDLVRVIERRVPSTGLQPHPRAEVAPGKGTYGGGPELRPRSRV